MKEFRIARCLDNNGKGIHEYAIFADGSRKKLIETDEKYGKYFEVDNELNTDVKNSLRFSFSGRIKDAIDTIRNGNGDCIMSFNLFGRHDSVLYFIDREVGEELRQKSMDGWKDTKFGWVIETGYKNSFSPYVALNEKNETIGIFDEDRTPKYFTLKEDAEQYIASLISTSFDYAKQCVDMVKEFSKDGWNKWFDKVKAETSKYNVVVDYACDMVNDTDGKASLKFDVPQLDEYGWKVVQAIIQ